MLGNMAGQGAGMASANPLANGAPIANPMMATPPTPSAGDNTWSSLNPVEPHLIGKGNKYELPDLLSVITRALHDPKEISVLMAKEGISPRDFQSAISGKSQKLASIMDAKSLTPDNPGGADKTLGSVMEPNDTSNESIWSKLNPIQSNLIGKGGKYELPNWREDAAAQGPAQSSDGESVWSQLNPVQPHLVGEGGKYALPKWELPKWHGAITLDMLTKLFESATPPGAKAAKSLGDKSIPIVPPVSPAQAATGNTLPTMPPPIAATGNTIPSSSAPVLPIIGQDYKPASNMGGAQGTAPNLTGNSIYDDFMGAVRSKINNPNALAAVAATGKSESGFNEHNAYGSWNDVGAPAGGVMSWRGPRLQAMRDFAAANGGDPNKPSAELQGKFFLQENPGLIEALNNAKTPEEAQTLMNNAWAFKGYQDTEHGEAARRIALARNMAGQFAKGENPIISGEGGSNSLGTDGAPSGSDGGIVAGNAATPGGSAGLNAKLAAFSAAMLDAMDSMGKVDMNSPKAPNPVLRQPQQFQPDPNMIKLMLGMLSPSSGVGMVPSLSQLMGR